MNSHFILINAERKVSLQILKNGMLPYSSIIFIVISISEVFTIRKIGHEVRKMTTFFARSFALAYSSLRRLVVERMFIFDPTFRSQFA